MYPTMLPFEVVLPNEPLAFDLTRLYQQLHTLPDRRARRGVRYPLPMLLLIAILAKLTGQAHVQAVADWAALRAKELARVFQFPRATMPHAATWSRVLGTAVDVVALEHLVRDSLYPPTSEIPNRASIALALDGKTLRGTIPLGHTQGVHLLAAYLPVEGVVLMQLEVRVKENEIIMAPTMLAHLDLTGVVVTGDAMYTQRTLSTQVVEAVGTTYGW